MLAEKRECTKKMKTSEGIKYIFNISPIDKIARLYEGFKKSYE